MRPVLDRQKFVEGQLVAEFRNEGFSVRDHDGVQIALVDHVPINLTRIAIDLERGLSTLIERKMP